MSTKKSNNENHDLGVRRSTRVRRAVNPFCPGDGSDKLNKYNSSECSTESDSSSSSHSKNRSSGSELSLNNGCDKSKKHYSSGSSTDSDSSSSSGSEDSSSDSEAELIDCNSKTGKTTSVKTKRKRGRCKTQPDRKKKKIQTRSVLQKEKKQISDETWNRKKEWARKKNELQKLAKEKQERGEQLNYKEREAILKLKRSSIKRSKYRKERSARIQEMCEKGNTSTIGEKKRKSMKQVEYNRKSLPKREKEICC